MNAEPRWIGMTPRTRLRGLFDYAFETRADLVIWEQDEPDAPAALREWAAERGVEIDPRPAPRPVLVVRKPTPIGRIEIYLRRSAVAP